MDASRETSLPSAQYGTPDDPTKLIRGGADFKYSEIQQQAFENRSGFGFEQLRTGLLEAQRNAANIAIESRRDTLIRNFYNRSALIDKVSESLAASREPLAEVDLNRRQVGPGVLYMMDLDFFKLVNDTYGHEAGDQAILATAEILAKFMKRPNDFGLRLAEEAIDSEAPSKEHQEDVAGRLGGDELVGFLFGVKKERAREILEQMRLAIPDAVRQRLAQFLHLDPPQLEHIPTATFGLAEAESDDDALSLLAKADLAQNAAKKAGRNRVFAYGDEEVVVNQETTEEHLSGVILGLISRYGYSPDQIIEAATSLKPQDKV